mmetsp:Transcript_23307/g.36471  ORF Transcript_23307/g.36471 Transcript_23307/m.36471 type:complete len:254 (+) Transcript_23307:714-1475(+)
MRPDWQPTWQAWASATAAASLRLRRQRPHRAPRWASLIQLWLPCPRPPRQPSPPRPSSSPASRTPWGLMGIWLSTPPPYLLPRPQACPSPRATSSSRAPLVLKHRLRLGLRPRPRHRPRCSSLLSNLPSRPSSLKFLSTPSTLRHSSQRNPRTPSPSSSRLSLSRMRACTITRPPRCLPRPTDTSRAWALPQARVPCSSSTTSSSNEANSTPAMPTASRLSPSRPSPKASRLRPNLRLRPRVRARVSRTCSRQ